MSGVIGQILNFPATCHPQYYPTEKYKLESTVENANESIVTTETMRFFWEQYVCTSEDGANILASPLLAPKKLLSKAPRTCKSAFCSFRCPFLSTARVPNLITKLTLVIVACGADPLRDEGMAYGQALDSAGADVQIDLYPGLPHGFVLEARLKSGGVFYERVVEFVQSVVDNADRQVSIQESKSASPQWRSPAFENWFLGCINPRKAKSKSETVPTSDKERPSITSSGSEVLSFTSPAESKG